MVLIIQCPMSAELYGEKCGKILHFILSFIQRLVGCH